MEKEKLLVQNGMREIEVNDKGECICIPMNDNSFFARFSAFLEWMDERQKTLVDKERRQMKEAETNGNDLDGIREAFRIQREICDEICGRLDDLFGEGCCRKVFVGIESPDIFLILDFVEQITPILQKLAKERNEKINLKYSRYRKGARGRR